MCKIVYSLSIHGSWFDPSNPVVKYSGSLMDELYSDMVEQAENAELVLVMGTSPQAHCGETTTL